MNRKIVNAVALALVMGSAISVWGQEPSPPPQPDGQILPPAQLDELIGPIALYPDPLIAEILPAATQPSQIVLAENYLDQGGDPNGVDSQAWDSSVKAVAHYPDVLKQLDMNLQWTVGLGQAFLNQPGDVMDSVQRLRAQAQSLGNLQTTPQQTVEADDGDIEIIPTNPEYLYVPTYDPGLVYYQSGVGIVFGGRFLFGTWLNHDFDWHRRNVIYWNRDHPRPGNWWRERPADRRTVLEHGNVWHPQSRPAGRPYPVTRGDRGYAPRPVERAPVTRRDAPPRAESRPVETRPIESRPVETRPVPSRPVEPQRPFAPVAPRPVPAPSPRVDVHTIPSRPTVAARQAPSAFSNVQSAPATRAASSRGAESRGPMGGGAAAGGGNNKKR